MGKEAFVRISDLAKEAELPASTIRYYTDMGLLTPAMHTEGGHQLYDAQNCLQKLRLIQALIRRGMSLPEVKEEIARRKQALKVLIVEDEPEVASLLEDFFKQSLGAGVVVLVAKDGFSAGKMYSAALPDLIILDLMLPGINGIEVCRLIRQDPDVRDAKILAVTGYNTPENAKAILSAGADAYLGKPFGLKELREKLKALGVSL